MIFYVLSGKLIVFFFSFRKESQEDLLSARSKDGSKVEVAEEDNAYAVFITYIEVYNNYVYDLLDNAFENDICAKYVKNSSYIGILHLLIVLSVDHNRN